MASGGHLRDVQVWAGGWDSAEGKYPSLSLPPVLAFCELYFTFSIRLGTPRDSSWG